MSGFKWSSSVLQEKCIMADGTHPHSNKVSSGFKIVLGGAVTVNIKNVVNNIINKISLD